MFRKVEDEHLHQDEDFQLRPEEWEEWDRMPELPDYPPISRQLLQSAFKESDTFFDLTEEESQAAVVPAFESIDSYLMYDDVSSSEALTSSTPAVDTGTTTTTTTTTNTTTTSPVAQHKRKRESDENITIEADALPTQSSSQPAHESASMHYQCIPLYKPEESVRKRRKKNKDNSKEDYVYSHSGLSLPGDAVLKGGYRKRYILEQGKRIAVVTKNWFWKRQYYFFHNHLPLTEAELHKMTFSPGDNRLRVDGCIVLASAHFVFKDTGEIVPVEAGIPKGNMKEINGRTIFAFSTYINHCKPVDQKKVVDRVAVSPPQRVMDAVVTHPLPPGTYAQSSKVGLTQFTRHSNKKTDEAHIEAAETLSVMLFKPN